MTEDVRPSGTYRTLDEQWEVLTPAEQRFEQARQTIGLVLGPIVFLVIWMLPGFLALIFGEESQIYSLVGSRLDEGTVAIIAAALLFILPVNWAERRDTHSLRGGALCPDPDNQDGPLGYLIRDHRLDPDRASDPHHGAARRLRVRWANMAKTRA
jgi:hypothetical protein